MGKIYETVKKDNFLIKEICFFMSGGYTLKYASTHLVANTTMTVPNMLSMAVIIVCWFIMTYNISTIIIGFIKWIGKGYNSSVKETYLK
jgi:hypothetical protein